MFNRMFKAAILGSSGFSLAACGVAREDDEPIGIIELDQSLADVEKPKDLPAGNYTGEIQDVQLATSQKGNRYFQIKFVIPPSEIPADLADDFEDGVVLYWNRVVVPDGKDRRALYNLKRFVEALGLSLDTAQIDPNEWMGTTARLKVVHETWQGETRASIKSVESGEAPVSKAKPAAPAAGKRARK